MSVSPTPAFMRRAIDAWHKDQTIGWVIHRTAEDIGYDGQDPFGYICNRPKTPLRKYSTYELKLMTRRWLARFFRPVSDALFDGKPDSDVIQIWIRTDRKDTGTASKLLRKTSEQMRNELIVKARLLSPNNGRFFRVK
jgi:hypothetical protein